MLPLPCNRPLQTRKSSLQDLNLPYLGHHSPQNEPPPKLNGFTLLLTFPSFSVEEILSNTLPRSQPISIIGPGSNSGGAASRPISRIIEGSVWQPETETPSVQIHPPSPMHKERPQSALVEPPQLPAKKRLGGATSELQMHQVSLAVKLPSAARLHPIPPPFYKQV